MLHLRGNVVGYTEAGSKQKWLRFITGRHDIPFYLPEFVAVQRSFCMFPSNADKDRIVNLQHPSLHQWTLSC